MNFTSPFFLVGFPIVWLLYGKSYGKTAPGDPGGSAISRRTLLLAASWLFYMGGSPSCFPLLLLVTLVTYFGAIAIEDAGDEPKDKTDAVVSASARTPRRKHILTAVLCGVFAILFFFKYFGLVQRSFFGAERLSLPLPPGISFYTFQSLAYCIDVYRGDLRAERRFKDYALFVSFFPQLVAGPIERAGSLLPQLRACPTPSEEDTLQGIFYLLRGFFKKIVIADFLSPYVSALFDAGQNTASGYTGPVTVLAGILFGFQIYADFSGYSDIALGAARMLGIRLHINFDSPFLACGIRDFWRRWHITLTRWFTDYVYIPLGGGRRGTAVQVRNILTVFLLSGFWHGADWHFAAWGLYHGLLLSIGVVWRRMRRHPRRCLIKSIYRIGVRLLITAMTFLLTSLGWILFRASSLRQACGMYAALGRGWTDVPLLRNAFAAGGAPIAFPSLLRLLLVPILLYLLREFPEAAAAAETDAVISAAAETAATGTAATGTAATGTAATETAATGTGASQTTGRDRKTVLQMAVYLMLAAITTAWLSNLAGGGANAFIYFRF